MTGALRLAGLLVRFRVRAGWNALVRAPRRRGLRVAWLLMLLGPVAYIGLFASALDTVREVATLDEQAALVGLVVAAIVVASVAGKMAMSEAVVGGSGENEFLLARPLSLPVLVLGRSLAGAATDLFDALFLFPVLLAAALTWRLGLAGVACAAAASVVAQIGVSAAAQGGQLVVVRVVAPARRRALWALLAMAAALTMAALWMVASWVLRRPVALLGVARAHMAALRAQPGHAFVAPLLALARGEGARALVGLSAPLAVSGALVGGALAAARWAGRAGWEQAGTPWAEAGRFPRRWLPMTPLTKDLALLLRDRSRLVTLLAVPLIFIGVQVFGSVGWEWTTRSAEHIAVLSFSLAAYLATVGPLRHMEAERRAFWLLRAAPLPIGRLLAWKAALWSGVVAGTAGLVYGGVLLAGRASVDAAGLGLGALVVVGAAAVACLAVAMGAAAADFSDDRHGLGLGVVYLFLLVAALFNVALVSAGEVRALSLALYLAAVALHWIAAVEQAEAVYDPPARRARGVVAADGVSWALLLFLGGRAQRLAAAALAGPREAAWAEAGWAGLVALGAAVYLVRRPRAPARMGVAPALGLALAIGLAAGAGRNLIASVSAPLAPLLVRALAEELAFRGVVQRALESRWRGRLAPAVVSALLVAAAGARPLGAGAAVAAVAPALAYAASGRLGAALIARLALELAVWSAV